VKGSISPALITTPVSSSKISISADTTLLGSSDPEEDFLPQPPKRIRSNDNVKTGVRVYGMTDINPGALE
jgi:hypothetical protein